MHNTHSPTITSTNPSSIYKYLHGTLSRCLVLSCSSQHLFPSNLPLLLFTHLLSCSHRIQLPIPANLSTKPIPHNIMIFPVTLTLFHAMNLLPHLSIAFLCHYFFKKTTTQFALCPVPLWLHQTGEATSEPIFHWPRPHER